MKLKTLLLLSFLLFISNSNAQSFLELFSKALESNKLAEAEQILHKWDLSDASDPDLYIGYFNYYTLKSLEKDSTKYDKQYAHKAIQFISEGIERYPTRFDMRIAKIYMFARLKEYKSFTANVIELIEYSQKINDNWKGEGFRLIENQQDMFNGAILDFQEILFKQNDTTLYNDIIKISEVMLKKNPKHVQSMLNISTVYITEKQFDNALNILLKAKEIEPNNAVLLYNIAYVYKVKGDKDNTRRYLELTVRNAIKKEEQLKELAQKQLDALR